mgnify:CR=1 FL=1
MAKEKKDKWQKKETKRNTTLLTDAQTKKLESMVTDMLDIAATVVDEYENLDIELGKDAEFAKKYSNLTALSSSVSQITQIHESSPFLDEILNGDQWKKIIKNIPTMPTNPEEDTDNDDTKWVNKRNSKESNGFNLI